MALDGGLEHDVELYEAVSHATMRYFFHSRSDEDFGVHSIPRSRRL